MDRVRTMRAVVRGRVQGVGFRAWAVRRAQAHGLAGWVRNRRDGSVETLARGEERAVEAFLADLRKGPWSSRVSGVEEQPVDPAVPDLPSPFEQWPTTA